MKPHPAPLKRFRLELPLPPSANNLFPGRKRRFKSKQYVAWINAADRYFLAQKRSITPLKGNYAMLVSLPKSARGDASNYIKAPEDYCVSRGLTPDDVQSQEVSARRVAGITLCVIEAWEV